MAPISLKKGLVDKLAGELVVHALQIEVHTFFSFKVLF